MSFVVYGALLCKNCCMKQLQHAETVSARKCFVLHVQLRKMQRCWSNNNCDKLLVSQVVK